MNSTTGCDQFDYAAGQPNLFLLSRFKQLLVRECGLEEGFELYCHTVIKQTNASLKLKSLESHYTYSMERSIAFREMFAPGKRFAILPPRVIGVGDHRPLRGTTRSFYLSCLEDVIVRGRSSIVEAAKSYLPTFRVTSLRASTTTSNSTALYSTGMVKTYG